MNDVKEKEPLPQSVEVLSHAAARAATFFSFWAVMRTASQVVTVRGCSVFVSILCSHTIRPRLSIFSISLRFQSYAVIQTATTQIPPSCPRTIISILCSHTDCDVYGVAVASKVITFQSYAVIQAATWWLRFHPQSWVFQSYAVTWTASSCFKSSSTGIKQFQSYAVTWTASATAYNDYIFYIM